MADIEKPLIDAVNSVADRAADQSLLINAIDPSDTISSTNINHEDNIQLKSVTSHPHDSEYDTASDLEAADDYDDDADINENEDGEEEELEEEEYDDDDDDTDDSVSDDDDKESVIDDDVENIEGANVLKSAKKTDRNVPKKVDEDRSNPQYIPKKGTFYEHDDRTADFVEPKGFKNKANNEIPVLSIAGTSSTTNYKPNPNMATPPKSTRGWRRASGVDHWSHDRFDAKEQAPKSRAELVSSYGYDIRTEDAPPKARRRKRYARGPNKYLRNWEDESAYLKTNNKERRNLRPSDFPPLNEKSTKPRLLQQNDEKENHMHRRQQENKLEGNERASSRRHSFRNDDYKESTESKVNKSKISPRPEGYRQVAMEFRPRKPYLNKFSQPASAGNNFNNNNNNRLETTGQRQSNMKAHIQVTVNANSISDHLQKNVPKQPQVGTKYKQTFSPQRQPQAYTHNNDNETANDGSKAEQEPGNQSTEQSNHSPPMINQISRQNAPIATKLNSTSSLAQRLQQLQNRNEPSHVGSVQMHAVASQNKQYQHKPQQQQQQVIVQPQAGNMLLNAAPLHSALPPPEMRGPPKRYSSLRRSQHEAQHIPDPQQHNAHQLQQMHLQQQQQQQPQMMLADQHILQANLMQLYHQENLQAQMQALQVSQGAITNKQSTYATVPTAVPPGPPPSQGTGPYAAPPPPPAAYYVTTPEAYAAAASNVQNPPPAQYSQQQQTHSYLQQPQTSANVTLAYGASSTAGQPFPVLAQPGAVPVTSSNFQNYNTVGGTTYFVPPPAQTAIRPIALPQRRPNNAIPILPPTEKNKTEDKQMRTYEPKEESKNTNIAEAQSSPAPTSVSSESNIDHIIDNMFVQRPTYKPPSSTATTPATCTDVSGSNSNLSTIAYTPVSPNKETCSTNATVDNITGTNTSENNGNENNAKLEQE